MASLEPIDPDSTLGQQLRTARAKAVDAHLEAEGLEAEARKARRRANSLRKHYEYLLEHGGQLDLPFNEGGTP